MFGDAIVANRGRSRVSSGQCTEVSMGSGGAGLYTSNAAVADP